MKNTVFRSIPFWKSAVMTMPDNSFFELMRSVFGKIKTPFNKQQLLNDLEKFLLSADIQKTILAYIDETDAKIIATTALFGEPAPEHLYNFFLDDFSRAQLQDIIVNLEERFIFYRFTEDKISHLALNPVLKNILLPFTEDTSALFPAAPAGKPPKKTNQSCINDLILATILSFITKCESVYKSEGLFRKKIIDEGKKLFPGIDLEQITGALQILGIIYTDSNKLIPDKKHLDDFCLLSSRERMEYCAAAILVYDELTPPFDILPPLFKNKIRELVNIIHSFLNSLKPECQYPEKTLKRMVEVLKHIRINADSLIKSLEITGLIEKISPEVKQLGINAVTKNMINTQDKPVITINSGSSILIYPEIKFIDAVKLAFILNIKETNPILGNTVVCFELDRESAVRSFNNNINADEIIKLLLQLSGKNIDETLVWNLKDWEKRYNEVSLKKGIVLQLAENNRYLSETEPLAGLIIETLTPGFYLLNENAMEDASDALRKAGIDIIAQRQISCVKTIDSTTTSHFSSPASAVSLQKNITLTDTKNKLKKDNSDITANFHNMLENISLSEAEKNELSARIDRRLVLCEAQLKDANIRYEKLEARHMDYTGKQNIAKQAISLQSPVEIVWSLKGKEKNIFGVPQALEKEGTDLILVIDKNRIPLAKISLLRRIKKSIFEI